MLELTNVINISVALTPTGLGEYNINNLALFTKDVPLEDSSSSSSSGAAGSGAPSEGVFGYYRVYVSAAAVAEDFGTTTEVYQQAVAVFSQNPNILAGGGSLIVFKQGANETLLAAIARTKDLIFYCGIIATEYPSSGDMKALADSVQAYGDKILFLPSYTYADVAGAFTTIKNASDYYTRCLYYSTSALDARLFAAAYAGRGMSVNFDGSRTTNTLQFKSLATIDPDDGISQTILTALTTAGVDSYVDIAGIPMVFSTGSNRFFDEVFGLIWFVSQLKVNGFNALRMTSTKVPQTEEGVKVLKGAYRLACEQGISNGFIAPGQWTSSEWFGNQEDMNNNILERGYYIYSQPVNAQTAADRALRKAPLIQIGIKEAGAIHSSTVVVNVNA